MNTSSERNSITFKNISSRINTQEGHINYDFEKL